MKISTANTPYLISAYGRDQFLGKSLLVLDYDGDGHEELLVFGSVKFSLSLDQLRIYSKDANNQLELTHSINMKRYNSINQHLVPGDFNGDGLTDIALIWDANAEILFQDASGDFPQSVYYEAKYIEVEGNPYRGILDSIEIADSNADGRADIIGFDRNDAKIIIWKDVKPGKIEAPKIIDLGFTPTPYTNLIFAGDINRDQRADLIFYGIADHKISIYFRGPGDGFSLFQVIDIGEYAEDAHLVDLDSDDVPDLLVSILDSTIVYKQQPDLSFSYSDTLSFEKILSIRDIDGDDDLDLLVTDLYSGNLKIVLQESDGSFNVTQISQNSVTSADLFDLDGDGYLDVMYSDNSFLDTIYNVIYGNKYPYSVLVGHKPTQVGDLFFKQEADKQAVSLKESDIPPVWSTVEGKQLLEEAYQVVQRSLFR